MGVMRRQSAASARTRRRSDGRRKRRGGSVHASVAGVRRGVSALLAASSNINSVWLQRAKRQEGEERSDEDDGDVLSSLRRQSEALEPGGYRARRARDDEVLDPALLSLTREYSRERLEAYFRKKPLLVASRLTEFASSLTRCIVASRHANAASVGPHSSSTSWQRLVREEVSRLGPVVVKCGQTLSQREDLVPRELADELKTLQDDNTPFPTSIAFDTIRRELGHDGPIAARIVDAAVEGVLGSCSDGSTHPSSSSSSSPPSSSFTRGAHRPAVPDAVDASTRPLFKSITSRPVASASLGQVYRATLWPDVDGGPAREVAVKVQRPGLLTFVAKDVYVLQLFLSLLRSFWDLGGGSGPDLTFIADNVGEGVFRELDYRTEAANCVEFGEKHAFLGFVRTPKIVSELTTRRVMVMEWVPGEKLGQIEDAWRRKLFVDRAIEAAAAQLLQTGMVHADPHEGNLLLDAENNLVFLDFGLVSYVEPRHQEAFSSGIVHLLTGNWRALAEDFIEMDFVPENFMCVADADEEAEEQSAQRWVSCSRDQFCDAIEEKMASYVRGYRQSGADIAPSTPPTADGASADGASADDVQSEGKGFGDLVAIFGGLSNEYRFLCPPYSILLGRSYATLEGIAGKVDPCFNVYEACVPFAIRRGLAPKTELYTESLRTSFLDARGAFRWQSLIESLELATTSAADGDGDGDGGGVVMAVEDGVVASSDAVCAADAARSTRAETQHENSSSSSSDSMTLIAGVLGAAEGKVLRRILWDASSSSIFEPLVQPSASAELRAALRSAVDAFVASIAARLAHALAAMFRFGQQCTRGGPRDGALEVAATERGAAAAREERWTRTVSRLLLRHHVSNLLRPNAKTALHESLFVLVSSCATLVSMFFSAVFKMGIRTAASSAARLRARLPPPSPPDCPTPSLPLVGSA